MTFYETFLSFRQTINRNITLAQSIDNSIAVATEKQARLSDIIEQEYNREINENSENIKKVRAFISIAESHTSTRIMPAKAEVFLSVELSKLSVRIDSTSRNDPFAAQLFTKAQAQLLYLKNNEAYLAGKHNQQLEAITKETSFLINQLNDRKVAAKNELIRFLSSDTVQAYVEQVKKISHQFLNSINGINLVLNEGNIYLGYLELPLIARNEYKEYFLQYLRDVYVSDTNSLRFPFEYNIKNGGVLLTEFDNNSEQRLFPLFQNLVLNVARYYTNYFDEILYIDPIRYNSSALGIVSALCDGKKSYISRVPTSSDNVRKKIDSIIANIEAEENRAIQENSIIKPKLLMFHNFPHGYDQTTISKIRQLCVNACHYKYTVVLTTNVTEKRSYIEDTLAYIKTIANIISFSNGIFSKSDGTESADISFFDSPAELPKDVQKKLLESRKNDKEGNKYIERVGLNWSFENKGNRYLDNIPYGIDKENELLYLDFENSNFATFICGASRSGKSTLLHTVLTGIFSKYHPDDVEVWLIDFKMTEFSRYIDHLPPHVRYLILDESPELVYDIINRLTEILIKRQNRFKGKWEKLSQVPKEKYMPSIFVVIDEFSVMSQIIADSATITNENYGAKLQMLLAKGAALGLHFIFSSQGFTNGTRGLSEYSKQQIQQRIAMKAQEYSEVKETLSLKNASDTDVAMMEQLPVYHTLTRIPMDDFGNHLKLANVLYFPDEDLPKQLAMIDDIKSELRPVDKFLPYDTGTYIDKKSLVIDGKRYKTFNDEFDKFKSYISNKNNANPVFFIGEPRRMLPIYPVEFSESFCENIMAIAPVSEKMAFTSILLSLAKTVELQGYRIIVLGHPKSQVFNQLVYGCNCSFKAISSLQKICDEISKIKDKIINGAEDKVFYFLLGFESIINEMSFIDDSISKVPDVKRSTKLTEDKSEKLAALTFDKREEGELDILQQLSLITGETKVDFSEFSEKFSDDNISLNELSHTDNEISPVGEYDARKDLKFILTQGPRLGYHFVMQFNSVNELEQTKTDVSFFRHKILFRIPRQDASLMIGSSHSAVIPEMQDHIFRYDDGICAVSFRPLLHPGLSWDGWSLNVDGTFSDEDYEEEYLM